MPPEHSLSYQLLQSGPFDVATEAHELVDRTRFIPDSDAPDGQSPRSMKVRLWYPESESHDPRPLLIYSHGLLGTGEAVGYIARVLASHGYVIAAPDFPRTNRSQRERAHARDVFNQPRDVALVIDWLLARSEDEEDELYDAIDAQRIAASWPFARSAQRALAGFSSGLAGTAHQGRRFARRPHRALHAQVPHDALDPVHGDRRTTGRFRGV